MSLLDIYRPSSLMVALWPTREFEFPEEMKSFGESIRAAFGDFNQARVVKATGPMPPEIPRLIMLDQTKQWRLELAPGKLSFQRLAPRNGRLETLFEDVIGRIGPMQSWLAENHNLRVHRIGVVTQFIAETRSSANEKIANYFLQPRALQGQKLHDIQLAMHARMALGPSGALVNRWLRVQPLRTRDGRRSDDAMRIEIDINTLVEDTHLRTAREVQEMLRAVRQHVEEELPLLHDPDFPS